MEIEAAVVEAPGESFRLVRLQMDAPGPDQVRVRIHACGVCHTDMVMRDGALPVPFPCIFGHEGAGVVEAVGPDVTSVEPGDHVLLSFHSCGTCPACHDHQPGYCAEFFPRNFLGGIGPGQGGIWRGDDRIGGNIFGQSAFASHAFAHSDNVVKIDRDLPLEILAPLGCGVQTGAGTVLETLRVQPGQSIAILGAGAVGLSAVMAAVIAGAGRIALLDRHAHRLDLGRELGATETADDIADLNGPFDHIMDTTGVPALLQQAMEKLALRGTLALVGAYPPGQMMEVEPSAVMGTGRRIVGVVEGGIDPRQFIPRLVGYYRAGKLPLEKLIRTYPFGAIEEAFHASETGAVIKPVLLMPDR
ncbi:NAD(P)-dependent alcohol dehydrogenase [Sphingomonas sp. So64.6b]|uniref:NAD(P)-dependent alcohol dehydrogenase n=1 Tax=Sphingomonas sp. So64.6b TaxID=2997354 RepID=UPI0015FF92B7|nr:NAD(P)-dependent alcohol dehydrogenase [Sphingomonas sp. So64.6b]